MAKFKVLLYNLQCGLRDWRDLNLASSQQKSPNHQILMLAKISSHTVYRSLGNIRSR